MTVDADLMKLYRRPMNLWVEDELTSEYLNEVWREPRILFLIAGSSDSVKPVVTLFCPRSRLMLRFSARFRGKCGFITKLAISSNHGICSRPQFRPRGV